LVRLTEMVMCLAVSVMVAPSRQVIHPRDERYQTGLALISKVVCDRTTDV
jgi:hypothetical protein